MELPFLPHSFPTKTVCLIISMAMALFMYIPLFRRFARRHHTRDLSKTFCWLNFAVQVNNGVLAISEHAYFLVFWYVMQTVATGVTLWLVYKYWDFPPPK
jgi:hypothetical protein